MNIGHTRVKLANAAIKLSFALAKARGDTKIKYGVSEDGTERGIEGLIEDALADIKEAGCSFERL